MKTAVRCLMGLLSVVLIGRTRTDSRERCQLSEISKHSELS